MPRLLLVGVALVVAVVAGCTETQSCDGAGSCAPSCVPDCAGKTCGADGCGGSCGMCGGGSACSGNGVCLAPPGAGDVIFTEIMVNPSAVSDDKGEWIELHNVSAKVLNLAGCYVEEDAATEFEFPASPPIEFGPGAHLVIAQSSNAADNGGISAPALFSPAQGFMTLSNAGGNLALACGGTVDAVNLSGFSLPPAGAAIALCPGAIDGVSNDSPSNWAPASSTYGNGDKGTPGAVNDGSGCP